MKPTVLLTGGAGYIGSHTAVVFLNAGYQVVILDNLCNSSADVPDRIAQITGQRAVFYQGDVRDAKTVARLLRAHDCEGILHFAGLKAVGESVSQPELYYDNNVVGAKVLLETGLAHGVCRFVFSSSATVYGSPKYLPLDENHPADQPTNPYARYKRMVELMLQELHLAQPQFKAAVLRYFNPIGAHESGLIGENPLGVPNNLLPYLLRVASGELAYLSVYGNDYPTKDGTGVRDYIHVMDLAAAHLQAFRAIGAKNSGYHIWNIGTGVGYSVLEIIERCERLVGRSIPYQVVGRRSGDVAEVYADSGKAQAELRWSIKRNLSDMLTDSWRWQNQGR